MNDPAVQLDRDASFADVRSWFDEKYREKLSWRHPTMKLALTMFLRNDGDVIVETGCTRAPDEYGDGNSSVIFSEFLDRYGGHLWSVDINAEHVALCESLTSEFNESRTVVASDSVEFLRERLPAEPRFPR